MKINYRYLYTISIFAAASAIASGYALWNNKDTIKEYTSIDRPAKIFPEYFGTIIPPNIAPLNFLVREDGTNYCIKIYSKQGQTIEVFTQSPKIMLPEDPWHRLLNNNRGEQLYLDIFVKKGNGKWNRFRTITNNIATDSIDSFLVYRKIPPVHNIWRQMGIYQRNLGNFDESIVLHNRHFQAGCINCHSFCQNHPNKMLIGIRSQEYGSSTLLVENNIVNKIGTKFSYISWHPSGRLAAYSINKPGQFFHTARNEIRDVIDLDSLLAYYLVDSRTVKVSSQLSKKERLETYPTWSPDGNYLYFCSAPKLWDNRNVVLPEHYKAIKYDLLRISYDVEKDQWGEVETVLSAQDTGLSILEPRISPDGRWLLFCMCDYGCFPVYQESSDLYLIDLKIALQTSQSKYYRLDINSEQSESWHSWSSNSRWIAFSSKRDYGVFTRIYLSHVDKTGKVHKPILLPQKDPTFYDACLYTFSVPELVVEPVKVTKDKLGRVVRSSRKISVDMPITMATPRLGAPPEPWRERE
ncbi:MAG: PD40 domain-containing protein [Planctomycetota bacterium]|nr:MAG: PD40 domain-containing protein [Planctomycetota bacterium]